MMGKKPQGGPHVKERKKLLADHGQNYALYRKGRLTESDIHMEVEQLRDRGIDFSEIVAAREKALKGEGRYAVSR